MLKQARTILKETFGYEEFRLLQEGIIENILQRKDSLVIMPTGGGKSLCYQIPALVFNGLTVVVSPLISLMKDQVEQLKELGVNAAVLNSSLSKEEYSINVLKIVRNEIKILYLAPETLLMQKTLTLLQSSKQVDCLAIDEAHCISEWGHDFRPEYRQIIEVRKQFPDAVCVALTATATPRVQSDIKVNLKFQNENEFISSFDRKNLFLQIVPKNNPDIQTINFLKKFSGQSGIIYCFSRRQVDELSDLLLSYNISAKPYHAGLSNVERQKNQELFIKDDVQIMVATIAFGMGINKPNIRFIVHHDLPQNIEGYYQQIGRAGRDGLEAHCLLLFSYGDIQKIKYFIDQKEEKEQRIANMHLSSLIGFAESEDCRRISLLNYFGEHYNEDNCSMCDNCRVDTKDLEDITIQAQKFLSCVKRTGEVFGAAHITDILRASKSQKILKFRHNELSTYGIGTDFSKKQWFHLVRQFVAKGLLVFDLEHGSLKLNSKSWEVMRSKFKVFGKIEDRTEDIYKKVYDELTQSRINDTVLFQLLKQKRKILADNANIPPYAIFSDKTLIDMSTYFPQSKECMLQMYGMGNVKFEKYGKVFIDIISDYCYENDLEEKIKISSVLPRKSGSRNTKKLKHIMIGEAYNGHSDIKDLMRKYNIKRQTVLNHLYKYVRTGNALYSDGFLAESSLSPKEIDIVLGYFDDFGSESLSLISEALGESIPYEELHLLRLYYLTQEEN
jgi:ATP-dependent DNA helicase RecQ